MQQRRTSGYAVISILLLGLLGSTAARAYSDLVILGDSLSDTGNLFTATGGALPQDPPYFQGRFSDGPAFVEHLYDGLRLPGILAPSFVGGTNYAVGGARTRYHTSDNPPTGFDPAVFDPLTDTTAVPAFTLQGQLGLLLSNSGGVLDPQALYSVWIGSNDVADAFTSVLLFGGNTSYAEQLLAQSAADIGLTIGSLVGAGANHLLIPTVPNLGLVPEVQALLPIVPTAEALATTLSQTFNDLVDAQLAGIAADITRLDTFDFLTALVADPTAFGLPASTNVSDACFTGFVGIPGTLCSDPEAFVFFDRIHPTAVTHALLGQLATQAVPAPAVLVLLLIGWAARLMVGRGRATARLAA